MSMMAWRIWSIACMAGMVACDSSADGPDATTQPRCSPTAAFGHPVALMSLNTANNEEQAKLSPDELTVYFSRDDGSGNYDIYQATRASKTAAFGGVAPVPGVNTPAEDREPQVTADG